MVESKSKVQSECEEKHKAEKTVYSWMSGKSKKKKFSFAENPNHFFDNKLWLKILPPLQRAIFYSKPSNFYKFAQNASGHKLISVKSE